MNSINMNNLSFRGKYLIPFNQIKDKETLQNIGLESSKYITNPNQVAQAPDGIVVDIDDKKAKEYEAIIAKYGVNIQKYDPSKAANKKVAFNGAPTEQPVPQPVPQPETKTTANIKEAPTPENPVEANPANK